MFRHCSIQHWLETKGFMNMRPRATQSMHNEIVFVPNQIRFFTSELLHVKTARTNNKLVNCCIVWISTHHSITTVLFFLRRKMQMFFQHANEDEDAWFTCCFCYVFFFVYELCIAGLCQNARCIGHL